jgi:serralysin
MATYKWAKGVSGDWNTAANWLGGAVPNGPAADVVIDAPPTGAPDYLLTIGAGFNDTVNSLDLASSNMGLQVNGTLTFAPGSAGALGREFQSSPLAINNGTIVNAGLMFTYIQTTGNVQFLGSNPIYIAWELQVLDGTATVDTSSIAQYTAATHTLFDGAFDALGSGRVINLGGKAGGFVVDIETLTGPKPSPSHSYWTQLEFDDPGSQINEWNGSSYVSVESSLKLIQNAAYVTVNGGRGYTTANALTIGKDGVFEEAGGTLSTGGLTVASGGLLIGGVSVTGSGPSTGQVVVQGAVTNNGQIVAQGPGLVFRNAIAGTGVITFNRTAPLPGRDIAIAAAVAGRLEVGAVGAGQTVRMIGGDTLVLDAPASFAGVIAGFDGTDKISVSSAAGAVTGASYAAGANGVGTLTLNSGATVLGSLKLAGNYAGSTFHVTPNTTTNTYDITKSADPANFLVTDTTTGVSSNAPGVAYTGPVAGLQHEYINLSPNSLNIAATVPNSFIHSGAGTDAIDVSKVSGNNVLDGSTGSNFLVGGAGNDTFFVDDRAAPAETWSSVVNFHAGDAATLFGVTAAGFVLDWEDNQGAAGATGLTLHALAAGKPIASLTLAGYSKADLDNGRLTTSFGQDPSSGSDYLYVHGN